MTDKHSPSSVEDIVGRLDSFALQARRAASLILSQSQEIERLRSIVRDALAWGDKYAIADECRHDRDREPDCMSCQALDWSDRARSLIKEGE